MTGTDPTQLPPEPGVHPVVAALRAADAALDAVAVLDELGRPSGWMPLSGMDAAALATAVGLQARLEGRLAGLRLLTVAAADRAGAATETAATDTAA